jgi:hypothetical protein
MIITQETANVINTLANAASQIDSTPASAAINKLIVSILPATGGESAEAIAEALRQDNEALQLELASLQISARIGAENLELLRGKLKTITEIANDSLGESASAVSEALVTILADGFREIITTAEPIADEVEA